MEKKNKQTCGEWKENKKKHVGKITVLSPRILEY
jgi:hypothetical protein